MWKIRELIAKPTQVGLKHHGIGPLSTDAIYADGELLIPNASLVDATDDPIQLEPCDFCGSPGCNSVGWVAPRSLGERIVLTPWFEDTTQERSLTPQEPPASIQRRGAAVLEGAVLEKARTFLNGLPAPSALPALTLHEALRCLQLEARDGTLGPSSSAPALQKELILACSEEDLPALVHAFEALIARARDERLVLAACVEHTPITFYLEGPRRHAEWSPVARLPSGALALRLAEGLAVEVVR